MTAHKINWDYLHRLTTKIPDNLDRDKKKESISDKTKAIVMERDKGICRLCGLKDEYGNNGRLQFHHIVPNSSEYKNNIITLCLHCHLLVHTILFIEGKWKHVRRQ